LVAEARHTRSEQGDVVYDGKWLVLRFYEQLIHAHWEKPYIDYGQETVPGLLAEYQHRLIQGGYIEGETSQTPVGPYVASVTGLTDLSTRALKEMPALKHEPGFWAEYIEREAYWSIPAEAADVWKQIAAEAVA
jgi:hypothetical protein